MNKVPHTPYKIRTTHNNVTKGRSDTVIERALAVLVNASFRNKSVADILLNGHCFEIIMELMQLHSQCGSVQRQCCMLLRNCAMHGADVQVCKSSGVSFVLTPCRMSFCV